MAVTDPDLLTRLREAMKDPDQAAVIRNEVKQSEDTLAGHMSSLGTAMQAAKNPSSQLATGLGGMAGLGLRMLMKKRQQPGKTPQQSPAGAIQAAEPQGGATVVNTAEPQGGATPKTDWSNATQVEVPKPAFAESGPVTAPPAPAAPSPMPAATPPVKLTGGPGNYRMGLDANGNNISSHDGGKTWINDRTGAQASGPVYQDTDIGTFSGMKKGGRVRTFALGGKGTDVPPEPAPEKRGVLMRRPMAIPILHTTIVITPHKKDDEPKKPKAKTKDSPKKPKPEAKKRGGPIKPQALPPKKGPESQGPPAPFAKGGHVQVPRGSGCAQRGKQFRGIY